MKTKPLAERFWPKVRKAGPDECWEWIARAKTAFGYGRMTSGRKVNLKAHRVAWAIHYGPVPDGMCVLHTCDNPGCCNPAHLFLGTKRDNTYDMIGKGRMKAPPTHWGETHPNTKFDTKTARKIAADRRPARLVAVEHGIAEMTVYRLRKGLTWKEPPHENQPGRP